MAAYIVAKALLTGGSSVCHKRGLVILNGIHSQKLFCKGCNSALVRTESQLQTGCGQEGQPSKREYKEKSGQKNRIQKCIQVCQVFFTICRVLVFVACPFDAEVCPCALAVGAAAGACAAGVCTEGQGQERHHLGHGLQRHHGHHQAPHAHTLRGGEPGLGECGGLNRLCSSSSFGYFASQSPETEVPRITVPFFVCV